jgi:hypothetical protein
MTTTRAQLEAMKRADWLLQKKYGSMHPSWFDAKASAEATRVLEERNSSRPRPDWLTKLFPLDDEDSEVESDDTGKPSTPSPDASTAPSDISKT